ncbi:MAG: phage major capsid protein [Patescibacteria group bacterium]
MTYSSKATGVLLSTSDTRATLQDIYDPILRDSQNNAATFYNILRQEPNIGDYARWVIRSARNSTVGSGSEYPDVSSGREERVKVGTPIKKNYGFIEVSDFEIRAYESAGIFPESIFTQEVQLGAMDVLAAGLNSVTAKSGVDYQLFRDGTGNNSLDMLGLSAWVDDGTNNGAVGTIAGVTRSSATTYMNAGLINTTTASISDSVLRAMEAQAIINGSRLDQLIWVTTPALKNSILNLMTPAQRYVTTEAKFGFRHMTDLPAYDDIPIYVDRHAESGKVYLLDMSTNAIRQLQPLHYEDMAKTATSRKGKLAIYAEMVCYNPNKNYVATNKS